MLWIRELGILHVLGHKSGLHLQLFPVLLQPFLLVVWDQHTRDLSLSIKEFSYNTLDFDSCKMLSSHWSRPWFLNDTLYKNNELELLFQFSTYSLTNSMLFLEIWNSSCSISSMNSWNLSNYRVFSTCRST